MGKRDQWSVKWSKLDFIFCVWDCRFIAGIGEGGKGEINGREREKT